MLSSANVIRINRLLATAIAISCIVVTLARPSLGGLHLTDYKPHDDDDDLTWTALLLGGAGIMYGGMMAFYGAANILEPVDAKPRWDETVIPKYEFSFTETWTFESRTSQQLLTGTESISSRGLDWTGAPGFATRFAVQPWKSLRIEAIFDYTSTDESQYFANVSGFGINPQISFAASTTEAKRQAKIASGQLNLLLRDHPFDYVFVGLRWWHQDDSLALRALPTGAAWFNETQANVPFLQVGGNLSLEGKRSIWVNRASTGVGAAWAISRTKTLQVPNVAIVPDSDEVQFAAFLDAKTELGYSITPRLAARFGAQILLLSTTYRSAAQIQSADLLNGTSSMNSDGLLLSSLYTGLSYKY